MEAQHWETDFQSLATQWARVSRPVDRPVDVRAWTARLLDMQSAMSQLQAHGRWAAGPHDLMTIVGLNRWELAHSAALGWLCTPDAGHGLGATVLEALLALTGDQVHRGGPVTTALEESRQVPFAGPPAPTLGGSDPSPDSLGGPPVRLDAGLTRADVVVRGSGWTLVIEVKVDAGEQPNQAQRLYEGWKDDGDARFIFLSRSGRRPSTISSELQHVWTGLAWRDVRTTLERLAAVANLNAVARPALLDYIVTLRTTF